MLNSNKPPERGAQPTNTDMKHIQNNLFDGKYNTSANVQVDTRDGSVCVWLYMRGQAAYTVHYRPNELDMALALAEYYTRKVNPDTLFLGLTREYPMLRLYSNRNAYSKRQQQKLGSRWKTVCYCEQTPYGLKPLYNPKKWNA